MTQRMKGALGFLLITGGLGIGWAWEGGYSDIRPAHSGGSGRAILARAQAVHGGFEVFSAIERVEYELEGIFANGLVRRSMAPFDQNSPRFRLAYRPRDPGGTYRLIENDAVYTVTPQTDPNSREAFFLRSIRHLLDLPFAMETATRLEHAGTASWNGQIYDRVYATWSDEEPPQDVDQYVLWVNQRTGQIDRFDTTVRGIARFLTARVEYRGYRKVKGVLVPLEIIVHDGVEGADFVHRWTVRSVRLEVQS